MEQEQNKELKSLLGNGAFNSVLLVSYFVTTTLASYANGSKFMTVVGIFATGCTIRDAYRMFRAWRKL